MPYCIKCGHELLENAKYCHKCGSEAVSAEREEEPSEQAPYESPMAEMYYEMLRPAAEEGEKSSVKHRKDSAKPFAGE